MNIIKLSVKTVSLISLFVVGSLVAEYHVTVYNDTPFSITATCKKVGAIPVKSVIILPNDHADCLCGGADCTNGVDVTIPMNANDPKDVIKLSTSWQLHCGNDEVHVMPVPVWESKTVSYFSGGVARLYTVWKVTGFQIGIGSGFVIPGDQPLQVYDDQVGIKIPQE